MMGTGLVLTERDEAEAAGAEAMPAARARAAAVKPILLTMLLMLLNIVLCVSFPFWVLLFCWFCYSVVTLFDVCQSHGRHLQLTITAPIIPGCALRETEKERGVP